MDRRRKSGSDNTTLKTRRERLVHNERLKHQASFMTNVGLIGGLGMVAGTAFAFWTAENSELNPFLSVLLILFGFGLAFGVAWKQNKDLENLVDPDEVPKPSTKKNGKRHTER